MNLAITAGYAREAIVVHLAGTLDTAGATALRQHLRQLFAAGHVRVVLDLHHVAVVDAAAIEVLLDARAHAHARRGYLRLACAPAVPEICSLDALDALGAEFTLYPCTDTARGVPPHYLDPGQRLAPGRPPPAGLVAGPRITTVQPAPFNGPAAGYDVTASPSTSQASQGRHPHGARPVL